MRSIHKDHLQASFYDCRKTLCAPELHVYFCVCFVHEYGWAHSHSFKGGLVYFLCDVLTYTWPVCFKYVPSLWVTPKKVMCLHQCISTPWDLRVVLLDNWGFVLLIMWNYCLFLWAQESATSRVPPLLKPRLICHTRTFFLYQSTSIGVVLCACRVHVYRTSDASVLPSET